MNFTRNTDLEDISVIPLKSTGRRLKSTGHALSTARVLKALKSTSGLKNEILFSKTFHSEGAPLLVSSLVLRSRDLGQIDLARIRKDKSDWLLEIGEVKSSQVGQEQFLRGQKQRLLNSQKFLSGIFGFRSKLLTLTP